MFCKAKTKKGNLCCNLSKYDGYCWIHRDISKYKMKEIKESVTNLHKFIESTLKI